MVLVRIGNTFKGLIITGGRRYCFEVMADETLTNPTIKLDWRLKKLLSSQLSNFLKNEFRDVQDLHDKFSDFVGDALNTNGEVYQLDWLKNPQDTCTLIKTLQEDIKTVGEYIKHVDIANRTVNVEMVDAQFRTHKAILKLTDGYPREPVKVLQIDMPTVKTLFNEDRFDFDRDVTVGDFCKTFEKAVTAFQEFWNIIAAIDLQCWVLDPPSPTFGDTYRRIKLSDTLSFGFVVDPLKPKQMPMIKLFGCQSDVDECREILQKNLEKEIWDSEKDLLYNISNLLELSVPNKMYGEGDDMFEGSQEAECAICFMQRLNNELPNEVCSQPNCKSIYHSLCLFTYLSSIPMNREYFGRVQGECPNCDNAISCSVPMFTKTNPKQTVLDM